MSVVARCPFQEYVYKINLRTDTCTQEDFKFLFRIFFSLLHEVSLDIYSNYLIQAEWPLTQTLGVLSASLLLASTSSRYADKISEDCTRSNIHQYLAVTDVH